MKKQLMFFAACLLTCSNIANAETIVSKMDGAKFLSKYPVSAVYKAITYNVIDAKYPFIIYFLMRSDKVKDLLNIRFDFKKVAPVAFAGSVNPSIDTTNKLLNLTYYRNDPIVIKVPSDLLKINTRKYDLKLDLVTFSEILAFLNNITSFSTVGASFVSSNNPDQMLNINSQPPKLVKNPSLTDPSYPDGYFAASISDKANTSYKITQGDKITFVSTYPNTEITGAREGSNIKLTLKDEHGTGNISIPSDMLSTILDFIKKTNNSDSKGIITSIASISIVSKAKMPNNLYLKLDIRPTNGCLAIYVSFCDSYTPF